MSQDRDIVGSMSSTITIPIGKKVVTLIDGEAQECTLLNEMRNVGYSVICNKKAYMVQNIYALHVSDESENEFFDSNAGKVVELYNSALADNGLGKICISAQIVDGDFKSIDFGIPFMLRVAQKPVKCLKGYVQKNHWELIGCTVIPATDDMPEDVTEDTIGFFESNELAVAKLISTMVSLHLQEYFSAR